MVLRTGIVILLNKSSSNNTDSINKPIIGTISCKYDISSEKTEIKILGDEFNKKSDFELYINGKKVKYTKKYNFSSFGIIDIEIKLQDNINMDNMFKGISSLISVEMESLNNTKIYSMKSTFENCENLEFFSINGFDVDNL